VKLKRVALDVRPVERTGDDEGTTGAIRLQSSDPRFCPCDDRVDVERNDAPLASVLVAP